MAVKKDLPVDPNGVYFISGDRVEYRPVLTGAKAKETFDSIPAVDVSQIFSSDSEVRKSIAREVDRAAKDVGFFYLINPPVSSEKFDDIFRAIEKLFSLPRDVQMKYHVDQSPAAKGFTPSDPTEKRKGFGAFRETFSMGNDYTNPEQHIIKVAPSDTVPLNLWPDKELPEFRESLYRYFHDVYVLAQKMVQIFSLALGLEETALDKFFETPLTDITINHYLPNPEATEYEQVLFPHADYGAFTMLAQRDVGGLEVLNANAKWVPVPVRENSFVINTGSYLEVISGGRWRSTVHRVCAKGNTERVSLPFFFSPSPTATIYPVIPCENSSFEGEQRDIGREHMRGMMADAPSHPFVKKLKALGLDSGDYTYEMVSQPITEHYKLLTVQGP